MKEILTYEIVIREPDQDFGILSEGHLGEAPYVAKVVGSDLLLDANGEQFALRNIAPQIAERIRGGNTGLFVINLHKDEVVEARVVPS